MDSDLERRRRSSIQMERIKAVIAAIQPGLVVVFEANPVEHTLRFGAETKDHISIISTSGNLALDQLESWTDDQLRTRLVSLAGGRL
jgi:hypothetical protein